MVNTVGIKFLYMFNLGMYSLDNPGANVLSVTSQAAGDHDKKNLTTTPLRETFRTASVAGWQEIAMEVNDLTTVADTIGILNHNLTDIAVVQVQFSTVANFSIIAATFNIPWREKHMVLQQDVGAAYRYWRFRILDPTNPCGYIEIGRILAGKSYYLTNNEDIADDFQLGLEDMAYQMKTEGFFRASNERVQIEKLGIRLEKLKTRPEPSDPDADFNYLELMKLFKEVGQVYPFLVLLDPEDTEFSILWGQITDLPSRGFNINRYVSMNFTIEEVY